MINIKKLTTDVQTDEKRNGGLLHLTANENQMSNTARNFLSSKLAERYFFGGGNESGFVPSEVNGYFLGLPGVNKLINEATDAAKEMLHATAVNINVLSGVHAMMCSILSTTEPGDLVMTMPIPMGGHFATVGILDRIGRKQAFLDFDQKKLKFEVKKIAKKVKELKAKAIYLDVSYYLNPHNLRELREAVGPKIIIIYDASHTVGLMMGQQFQDPLNEGADVISANTHKTLPGPHKGLLAFKDKALAEKANSIINGCLYSSPHMTHLIALSITLLEMKEFGEEYAKQVIANSRALSKAFENLGYEVRKANTGEYSHTHQSHIFIDNMGDAQKLYSQLIHNGINANAGCNPLGNRMFMRLGTQEITRRGMKENDMTTIACLMDKALKGEDVKKAVSTFNSQFSKIHYSFDSLFAN